jgi:hypothetical protein
MSESRTWWLMCMIVAVLATKAMAFMLGRGEPVEYSPMPLGCGASWALTFMWADLVGRGG